MNSTRTMRNVDNDQDCDHGRISLSPGSLTRCRQAVTRAGFDTVPAEDRAAADFTPNGVVNAHMNATGHSNPPVAIPIQLMALIAPACG